MMGKLLIGLIFLVPIVALIVHLLLPRRSTTPRFWLQTVMVLVWLGVSITLLATTTRPIVIMMGNWVAPFGISLVIDQLAKVMLVVFAVVATCISMYSLQDQELAKRHAGFYAGFWLLLLGICGALMTADIFNLYVWFEVMLVSAFILLACSTQMKPRAMMHYATMNITGTLLMLLSIAFLYGVFGTLSYAGIAQQLTAQSSPWATAILCLFLFALGVKGAAFPLYFWLPTAYPHTSTSATMLLSSLITKVVMVTLLRLAWLWPPLHAPFLSHSILVVALATMFFGVMGAANQFRFSAILSFHIVSQLGYILLAIVLPLPLAIIAGAYFLIHNIFVKTALFMVAGAVKQRTGTDDLHQLGTLLKDHKALGIAFFIAAMSLAGFPPLSGFWAKFFVIKAALSAHFYWSAVVAIVVSLFTLYSMIKIWRYVFCEPASQPQPSTPKTTGFSLALYGALVPLLLLSILMGVWPDAILHDLHPVLAQLPGGLV